jgi:hypothetical protein
MSTSDNKSEVPEIDSIPKYEPCIPDHMLKNINNAGTKYIIEQLSIMQQNRSWQNQKIQEIFHYTNKINGQVISLSEWRRDVMKQLALEDSIEKERIQSEKERTKLYKIIAGLFLFVVYPLFLTQWSPGSALSHAIKAIW